MIAHGMLIAFYKRSHSHELLGLGITMRCKAFHKHAIWFAACVLPIAAPAAARAPAHGQPAEAPQGTAKNLGAYWGFAPHAGGLACQYATSGAGMYYRVATSLSLTSGALSAVQTLAAGGTKANAPTLPQEASLFKDNLQAGLGGAALFHQGRRGDDGSWSRRDGLKRQCPMHSPFSAERDMVC